jgi:hypothetical protein
VSFTSRARKNSLVFWLVVGTAIGGAAVYAALQPHGSLEALPQARAVERVETAPMCPWREPEADLQRFFPGATGYDTEIRILSGLRVELARRLGRAPSAEENAMYLYQVHGPAGTLGTVLVRRAKGDYGAIEVVLAVDNSGRVVGARLQRQREPEAAARFLTSPEWLGTFRGETAEGGPAAENAPAVPETAADSARAVTQGIHDMLVLLELARERGIQKSSPSQHADPGHP